METAKRVTDILPETTDSSIAEIAQMIESEPKTVINMLINYIEKIVD